MPMKISICKFDDLMAGNLSSKSHNRFVMFADRVKFFDALHQINGNLGQTLGLIIDENIQKFSKFHFFIYPVDFIWGENVYLLTESRDIKENLEWQDSLDESVFEEGAAQIRLIFWRKQ